MSYIDVFKKHVLILKCIIQINIKSNFKENVYLVVVSPYVARRYFSKYYKYKLANRKIDIKIFWYKVKLLVDKSCHRDTMYLFPRKHPLSSWSIE